MCTVLLFQVTVEDHVKVMEAFSPDIAQSLCDTIPASIGDVSIKRVRKSVDRTLKFLDETLLAAETSKVCTYISTVQYLIQNSPAVKKCAAPKNEKMGKPKWRPRNGYDGRLKAKILITRIQVNLCLPSPHFSMI